MEPIWVYVFEFLIALFFVAVGFVAGLLVTRSNYLPVLKYHRAVEKHLLRQIQALGGEAVRTWRCE